MTLQLNWTKKKFVSPPVWNCVPYERQRSLIRDALVDCILVFGVFKAFLKDAATDVVEELPATRLEIYVADSTANLRRSAISTIGASGPVGRRIALD